MDDDELLDLVNSQDSVIGEIKRRVFEDNRPSNTYIRGAAALIKREDGCYWIPCRSAIKQSEPETLDFSVAEHVGKGEDYLEAIIRGFCEELGMTILPSQLDESTKLKPYKDSPWFTQIYIFNSNQAPSEYRHEFSHATWLTADEILELHRNGSPIRSGLARLINAHSKK